MDLNSKVDKLIQTLSDDRVKDQAKNDAAVELAGIVLKTLIRLTEAVEKLANKP